MDTAHWPHQELGLVKPMEEMVPGSANPSATQARPQLMERRARPQKEKALNCPRCNSTNTKFCYYNNYSLTQPRYFCKTCRRYWTEGGSLRNVPVGGGSRKNKRPNSSSATASASATQATASLTADHSTCAAATYTAVSPSSVISNHARKLMHEAQDLNLAFNHHTVPVPEFSFPSLESSTVRSNNSTGANNNGSVGAISAMELLRSGIGSGSLGSGFIPMSVPDQYTTGFGLQHEFRPPHTLAFSLDASIGVGAGGRASAVAGGFVGIPAVQETGNGSRLLFPFGDLKPVISSSASEYESNNNKEQGLFWNTLLGGGGSATGGGATGDGVSGNGASW